MKKIRIQKLTVKEFLELERIKETEDDVEKREKLQRMQEAQRMLAEMLAILERKIQEKFGEEV